jgi:hypothetical protein
MRQPVKRVIYISCLFVCGLLPLAAGCFFGLVLLRITFTPLQVFQPV